MISFSRCTEAAKEIYHIPKVLYHWRCHQNSTSSNPESKMYAFEAGSRAIMAHYKRMGIEAERVEKGVDYGIYRTRFAIQGEPLISVIIPNKDHSGGSGHLRPLSDGAIHLQEPGICDCGEQQHGSGHLCLLRENAEGASKLPGGGLEGGVQLLRHQ